MKKIMAILKRILGLMYYGVMLLKLAGIRVFLKKLKQQIYSRSNQISISLDLEQLELPKIEANIKYTLKLATKEDMEEVMEKAKAESREMVEKVLFRKWMFEDGYQNCYVASFRLSKRKGLPRTGLSSRYIIDSGMNKKRSMRI